MISKVLSMVVVGECSVFSSYFFMIFLKGVSFINFNCLLSCSEITCPESKVGEVVLELLEWVWVGDKEISSFLTMGFVVLVILFSKNSKGAESSSSHVSFLIFFGVMNSFYLYFIESFSLFSFIMVMILSYFSLVSILYGSGNSGGVLILIGFKVFADLGIVLFIGDMVFSFNLGVLGGSGVLGSNIFKWFLIGAALIYCFVGVVSVWLFWAMNSSGDMSSYLHSVGIVLIGGVLMAQLEKMGGMKVYFDVEVVEVLGVGVLLNFIFLMGLFLGGDMDKKGFSYFSCASVCFYYLLTLFSVDMGLEYFLYNYIFKVFCFMWLDYISESGGSNPIFFSFFSGSLGYVSIFLVGWFFVEVIFFGWTGNTGTFWKMGATIVEICVSFSEKGVEGVSKMGVFKIMEALLGYFFKGYEFMAKILMEMEGVKTMFGLIFAGKVNFLYFKNKTFMSPKSEMGSGVLGGGILSGAMILFVFILMVNPKMLFISSMAFCFVLVVLFFFMSELEGLEVMGSSGFKGLEKTMSELSKSEVFGSWGKTGKFSFKKDLEGGVSSVGEWWKS